MCRKLNIYTIQGTKFDECVYRAIFLCGNRLRDIIIILLLL